METPASDAPRTARIASLLAPALLALYAARTAARPNAGSLRGASVVLAVLDAVALAVIAARVVDALRRRGPDEGVATTVLREFDVLTATGAGLSWTSALGVVVAARTGWPSVSIVSLLGLGTLHVMVLYTGLVARGPDPFRAASLTRTLSPATPTEGTPVREQLRFDGARVPPGFRLLARGRVGARWPLARYALLDIESSGEVTLSSDLGPAIRGEHRAEPLELWLQDVFGLCRSRIVHAGGGAEITVLPRTRDVEKGSYAARKDGFANDTRPAERLPTEGSLRLREYQPGDDARRIHWVRSLAAGELVVRLPDELPRDRPAVTLVLDTHIVPWFFEDDRAPGGADPGSAILVGALLDALVSVWLSVGRSLSSQGIRVTMLTSVRDHGGALVPRTLKLNGLSLNAAQTLGASVGWQCEQTAAQLIDAHVPHGRAHEVLVVSAHSLRESEAHAAPRIVVAPGDWVACPPMAVPASGAFLPFAMGSADNRRRRVRAEARRRAELVDEYGLLGAWASGVVRRACDVVARPTAAGHIRLEVSQ